MDTLENNTEKKIEQPSPSDIKKIRRAVGLTQTEAGTLVFVPLRSWQRWEAAEGTANQNRMPLAAWELFLIKTKYKVP